MGDYLSKVEVASRELKSYMKSEPKLAIILGSGLGVVADQVDEAVEVDYSSLSFFPVSTVEGHAGKFVIGKLSGIDVIVMQGRFHYYEGYDMKEVTFPVRVLRNLGIANLLVTNAAGGVNTSFSAGDLMLISDHINNSGDNPLIGQNLDGFGPRFPDMSEVYDKEINARVLESAERLGIQMKQGVYQFNAGPSYETPAEIRMARVIGSDAVGMSTVPEAIVARHSGIKVTGISCITNMAAGILDRPLCHEEVVETAERVKDTFIKLVLEIIPHLR